MKTSLINNAKKITAAILFAGMSFGVSANNIAVTNSSITNQNTAGDFTHVKFDISWENSWRTSTHESNWDAAYIFVKYRIPPMNTWHHATLNYVDGTAANDGNTEPTGGKINTSTDGMGAFLYRSANGIGNVNYTGAQLRWNYGVDGLNDEDSVEICVFAVEMAYVPQGAFYAGDGSVTTVQGQFEDGVSGNPFYVTSENPITLGGGGVGSLGNNNRSGMQVPSYEDFSDGISKTLPAAFPKGFNAFYSMKYEITQGQYADFLNKLNLTQATARYMGAYNTAHQSITGTHPAFAADAPDRPLAYINYDDFLTYLDWSGLRPMTELEYEKASRGDRGVGMLPTADEYAWGDVSIKTGAYTLTNPGLPNETINAVTTIGNTSYRSTNNSRSYRAGAIAASQATPNRVEAGATYYGVMEMSGNQWEFAMSVGRAEGRLFIGNHGDGEITAAGSFDVTTWPGLYGMGIRGGAYDAYDYQLRTSGRQYGHYHNNNATRVLSYGGRGVKTAQ
jgi:formylglycine-generating enzyme required for sulfatase activity